MGRIEAICTGAVKGGKKLPQPAVRFAANHGIEGDAHAGPWHRQVSVLAAEDIEEMRQRALPSLKDGDFAGLALLQKNYGLVGVKADG